MRKIPKKSMFSLSEGSPVGVRFWGMVDKGGPTITGMDTNCWVWRRGKRVGYGSFWIEGETRAAHRLSLSWSLGRDVGDAFVCHRCDNRACVRPDHLFIGDVLSNALDASRKGRLAFGSRNGARIHSERLLRGKEWMHKHDKGILRGKKHWTRIHPERMLRGSDHPHSKLNEKDVIEIRSMAGRGVTNAEIAKGFGLHPGHVWKIVTRRQWEHV